MLSTNSDVEGSDAAAEGDFTHAALLYHTEHEYLDEVVPFVRDGLALDQPVLLALPAGNLALVSDALGDAATEVAMIDLSAVGRNPGRVLGLEAAFAAKHPERPLRMVGELMWPGRPADEYSACIEHEALVNVAFADHDAIGLCPFNANRLDDDMLADALATHPLLWQAGATRPNTRYAPEAALARHDQPLTNSAAGVKYTVTKLSDLAAARSFASRYAGWLGLSAEGIADLQLIVTELATNSLQHAKSPCRLAFWQDDSRLVCEARDRGRLSDPLTGRLPPKPDDATGRGLYLVNALADLVRSHTTDTGTTIQAHLRLGRDGG